MHSSLYRRPFGGVIALFSAVAIAGSLVWGGSPAFAADAVSRGVLEAPTNGGSVSHPVNLQVSAVSADNRLNFSITGSGAAGLNNEMSSLECISVALVDHGQQTIEVPHLEGSVTTSSVSGNGEFVVPEGQLWLDNDSTRSAIGTDIVAWPADEPLGAENLLGRVPLQTEIPSQSLDPENVDTQLSGDVSAERRDPVSDPPLSSKASPTATAPALVVESEEVANESLVVRITGTGFEDVPKLPGQTEPHVYAMLSAVEADLSDVSQGDNAVSMEVVDGKIASTLTVPVTELNRDETYEVITWPSRTNPSDANIYARASVQIDWDALIPASTPRFNSLSIAANASGMTVSVEGENFTREKFGDAISVALLKRGASTGAIAEATSGTDVNGKIAVDLVAPKAELDRSLSYDVVMLRDGETGGVAVRQALSVKQEHWNKIFGLPTPGKVVVKNLKVAPEGLSSEIHATGLPSDRVYVAIIERGTEASLTQDGGYADFLYEPEVKNGTGVFTFLTPKESLKRSSKYEVLVWKSHSNPTKDSIYGRADLEISNSQWDALQGTTTVAKPVAPSPAPAPTRRGVAAGSLTWGISSSFADYTTNPNRPGGKSGGKILTNGVGKSGGSFTFPQAAGGDWNQETQTGSVPFSGIVTFTAHKGLMNEVFSNPSITVTSASAATLQVSGRSYAVNLGAASKSIGASGEVTWSGAPVSGSISGGSGGAGGSLGIDPVTFTVGAASGVSFGTTVASSPDKKQYTAADTPPATTGVTVLTDAEKLTPGGRIEIEASGFDPDDEGVLVVLYSDPIVLDDAATADKNGVVRWSGTLPKDVRGTHTITIQGSTNAGAVIDIVEPKKKKSARSADVETEALSGAVAEDRVTSAAIIPAGGMALWEWWASAAGLAAIAACMTLLTIRQRRDSA